MDVCFGKWSLANLFSHADFMLLWCRGLWLFALCNNPQWFAQIKAHLRPSSVFAPRLNVRDETFNKFRGRICASIKNFCAIPSPLQQWLYFNRSSLIDELTNCCLQIVCYLSITHYYCYYWWLECCKSDARAFYCIRSWLWINF